MGDEGNLAFNEAVSIRVRGALTPEEVEAALRAIVDRHDALRTTFTARGDELCVTAENRFELELVTPSPDLGAGEAVAALWGRVATEPMDLTNGPLFRAFWLPIGPDEAELVVVGHHAVCDGWSFHVVLSELERLCTAGAPELPKAPSFADFAERDEAERASRSSAKYWREIFETVPPVLDLPTDRPRPAVRTFSADRVDHVFPDALAKDLAKLAGSVRASVVSVALAGVGTMLHRLSGASDLVLGLPVARQSVEGLDDLVGHGVQLLPVRFRIESTTPFSEVVDQAKAGIFATQEHFRYTFGALVRDLGLSGDASRVPLIPVIFNIDQPLGEIQLGSATGTVRSVPRQAENFEMFLNVLPASGRFVLEATFNTDLFDVDTVQSWLRGLESILRHACEEPESPVGALRLAPGGISADYLSLNDKSGPAPPPSWLTALAAAVEEDPTAVAASDEHESLTYEEFGLRARRLAGWLRSEGVGPDDVIGLHLERSVRLPLAITAVHLAGAAYLPLDPAFPAGRLAYMVEDSGATAILSDTESVPLELSEASRVLAIGEASADAAPEPIQIPDGSDLAYLIYTSGSTGQPKGVEVTHQNVANFLASMATTPGLGAADTLLAVTTPSFDISVLELLLPLTVGGHLAVASRSATLDAQELAKLLDDHSVTVMQATPATWRMLISEGWTGREGLVALCGGEPLPPTLVQDLLPKVGRLWNMFGPTETTVWSTCVEVTSSTTRITVGTPIANTQVYVLSSDRAPLPAGVPGELAIGGLGVARGYRSRADLTEARFPTLPDLGRVYLTGDRGRLLPSGEIEHLGRLDDQVKVRGFRIELGEIDTALAESPDVSAAASYVWFPGPEDARIVACYVAAGSGPPSTVKLRRHLRSRLPDYMVPQYFLTVDALPVSPSGKLDRSALPEPVTSESRLGKVESVANPVEATVADIWTNLLKPARPIGRSDRFFEMGGHSLLALEAIRQMDQRFGLRVPVRALLLETLSEIATRFASADGKASSSEGPRPLDPAAERRFSARQVEIFEAWRRGEAQSFHLPFATLLEGAFDPERFQGALRTIVTRHEPLRTVVSGDGDAVRPSIRTAEDLFVCDFVDLTSESEPVEAALADMERRVQEPFDLESGPVVRFALIRVGPDRHYFFAMPHEMFFDGWSFDILLKEIDQLYGADEDADSAPPPELAISFSDFSTWERGQPSEAPHEVDAYWTRVLSDLSERASWRPETAQTAGIGRIGVGVGEHRFSTFERLVTKTGAGPHLVVMAAFAAALREFMPDEAVIGTAVAGRHLPETLPLIGSFYHIQPIRIPTGSRSGRELLSSVQDVTREAMMGAEVSYQQLSTLAERLGAVEALRPQVTFSYQDSRRRRTELGSLRSSEVSLPRIGLAAEIELWVRHTPAAIVGGLDYREECVSRDAAERIASGFEEGLSSLAAEILGA